MKLLVPKRWLTVRNMLLVIILLLVLLVLASCARPSNPDPHPVIVDHAQRR